MAKSASILPVHFNSFVGFVEMANSSLCILAHYDKGLVLLRWQMVSSSFSHIATKLWFIQDRKKVFHSLLHLVTCFYFVEIAKSSPCILAYCVKESDFERGQ